MSSLAKKKCRRYSVEYLAFGFVSSPRDQLLPMCLLCMCTFSNESMKPCKLKKHLISAHPENKDKPLEYFLSLRDSFKKRRTLPQIIGQCSQTLDKGTVASYKISKLIAHTGNAHNVGESLILPSVSIIMSDVMNLNAKDTVQAIPLSNSTVCRRIEEMANDVEDQLVSLLQTKKFSLQIDETTLQDNDALLMAYVRL
uniref:BED-type domain-containing protein n=1 Tax=Trichuris muris TaxID=70415 RepID=A0A5S6Q6I7_TRIMR